MKKRYILILILFLFFPLSIYAETAANALTLLLGLMQSMQAEFSQKIIDNKGGKVLQQSQGFMWLQRPGKFRWEVKSPTPQLIIANNAKLWIYDPDLSQVTIRSISKELGSTPALLLSDPSHALASNFTVSYAAEEHGVQWFLLKPNDQDSMFAVIKLGFDKKFTVRGMILQDNLGHVTHVNFNNVKLNAKIVPALFNFKAPLKVDVIDETKQG